MSLHYRTKEGIEDEYGECFDAEWWGANELPSSSFNKYFQNKLERRYRKKYDLECTVKISKLFVNL